MVKIRFKRFGRRHSPFYRLNAIDSRSPRDGKVIEQLGWFNPLAKENEKAYEFKADRVQYWLSVGAQPSDTARDMLAKAGVIEKKDEKKASRTRGAK